MNIFVTGSTGFIGRHLVRRLSELGHSVKCLVRNPNASGPEDISGVTIVRDDLNFSLTLSKHLDGIEAVYCLGAMNGVFGTLSRKPMVFNFQKAHEVV